MTTTTDLTIAPTTRPIRNRVLAMEWADGEGVDEFDRPCKFFVTLTCQHDSGRKVMFAHLRREHVSDEGGFTVRGTMLFDFVSVLTEPVARYSDKALVAFAERALEQLRENLDAEKVRAILDAPKKAA